MDPTSLSNTYKLFRQLHMLRKCTWTSPFCITASLIGQQAFGKYLKFWVPPRDNQEDSVIVEARHPSNMAPTSVLSTYEVFHNFHMLWMCIWMTPFHITASLTKQAVGSCLEFWVPMRGYQQRIEDVEAIDPSKIAPI